MFKLKIQKERIRLQYRMCNKPYFDKTDTKHIRFHFSMKDRNASCLHQKHRVNQINEKSTVLYFENA